MGPGSQKMGPSDNPDGTCVAKIGDPAQKAGPGDDPDVGPGGPGCGPASKKWDAVTTQMGLVWEKWDPVKQGRTDGITNSGEALSAPLHFRHVPAPASGAQIIETAEDSAA